MADGLTLKVGGSIDRWIQGTRDLERMGVVSTAAFEKALKLAGETMFGKSQDFVHVVTGKLKSSCDGPKVRKEPLAIVMELTYDTDYAIYEHARGGDHAWLTLAFEATEAEFPRMLVAGWEAMAFTWK